MQVLSLREKRVIISNTTFCPFSFRTNVISRYDGTISVEISAGNKYLEHKHQLKSSIYLLQFQKLMISLNAL